MQGRCSKQNEFFALATEYSIFQAIHGTQTCEDYQDTLAGGHKITERYINDLKNSGDVMNCPKCQASLLKIIFQIKDLTSISVDVLGAN